MLMVVLLLSMHHFSVQASLSSPVQCQAATLAQDVLDLPLTVLSQLRMSTNFVVVEAQEPAVSAATRLPARCQST